MEEVLKSNQIRTPPFAALKEEILLKFNLRKTLELTLSFHGIPH